MRKPFLLVALLTSLFGAGYVVGQVAGIPAIFAASSHPTSATPSSTPGRFWSHRFGTFVTGQSTPHAAGKVTAFSGNTITITPIAGRFGGTATTILVTSSTTYHSIPGTVATKSSITVGSMVVARGTLTSNGTSLTATDVIVLPAGFTSGFHHGDLDPHAAGQVSAVNGDTISIKPFTERDGQTSTVTRIVVTGSTRYAKGFNAAATKADVKSGVYVRAEGTLSSDKTTITASKVQIVSGTPGGAWGSMEGHHSSFFGPHADGKVSAVSGNTITITPDANDAGSKVTTITLTGSTQFFAGPGATASKASVKVGSWVAARGTVNSDGTTLTATRLIVLPSAPAFQGHFYRGNASGRSGSNTTI